MVISQHIETDYIAPDTIEEIEKAMKLLSLWVGQAALASNLIAPGVGSSDSALIEQGRILLETHPEQVGTLEVLAHGIERSTTPAQILKAAEGYRAYKEMLVFGCMKIVINHCKDQGCTMFEFQKQVSENLREDQELSDAICEPFRNMGGQLVSEPQILSLIQNIEEGRLDSWEAIHAQYDQWWERYPMVKAIVALQTLQRISQTIELDSTHWDTLVTRFNVLCDQNAFEVYRSRKKDFDDPFRKIVYRNETEMTAVLGRTDENPFVLESRRAMESLKEMVHRFPPRS